MLMIYFQQYINPLSWPIAGKSLVPSWWCWIPMNNLPSCLFLEVSQRSPTKLGHCACCWDQTFVLISSWWKLLITPVCNFRFSREIGVCFSHVNKTTWSLIKRKIYSYIHNAFSYTIIPYAYATIISSHYKIV